MRQNRSFCVALCGMLAALAVLLLCAAGLIPFTTYLLPGLAGIALMPIAQELGGRWASAAFCAAAVLGLLLGPSKEAALLFALFFGYYPCTRFAISRLPGLPVRWGCKLLLFNAAMLLVFWCSVQLLGVPVESFSIGGVYSPLLLLAFGNGVFVLYDSVLGNMALYYKAWFRRLLHRF